MDSGIEKTHARRELKDIAPQVAYRCGDSTG
ncbi:hypothetical protein SAMN02787142_4594 [Burkholderia sp. WP9]|jgi:hypothetical protein|nr:hypothetical protein SAMN02787142_4594 [Burkholderia sp. WP9]